MSPKGPAAPGQGRQATSAEAWLGPQHWRLGSGLVLFAYVLTHLLNHALGLVSLEAMEAMQVWRRGFWQSPPGALLLYGAVTVHVGLAFAKLARRRTWRLAPWELLQIGLGLVVLYYGARHVAGIRFTGTLYGLSDDYAVVLRRLWPGAASSQAILVTAAWLHAMIGLHNWLKVKPGYGRWRDGLLVLAVLVPTLALTGWLHASRQIEFSAAGLGVVTDELRLASNALVAWATTLVWAALGLLVATVLALRAARWFRRGPPVTYAGRRTVRAAPGATLLEISRMHGIPHASVCGGRGRCTTCRVLVTDGAERLPSPNPTEEAALRRIHAPENVRLACQVRPDHALGVRPLIPVAASGQRLTPEAQAWGVEERITILFADLRGFTSLAERLYPYDSVFLLNRYAEVMTEAVERNGGMIDKFIGDGVMALFGLGRGLPHGGRDALFAARDMLAALDGLNAEFAATLASPLRMGIGIHTGGVVLGRVGRGRDAMLTALGDSVNIASRLEGLNKEFGSVLVASRTTLDDSGLAIENAEMREVPVRGRAQGLPVAVAAAAPNLRERASPAPAAPAPAGLPA